jgi:hypothetical protein
VVRHGQVNLPNERENSGLLSEGDILFLFRAPQLRLLGVFFFFFGLLGGDMDFIISAR